MWSVVARNCRCVTECVERGGKELQMSDRVCGVLVARLLREKRKKKTEVLLQSRLSSANQTWTALGSNQGSDDARQANIRLGYIMAYIYCDILQASSLKRKCS